MPVISLLALCAFAVAFSTSASAFTESEKRLFDRTRPAPVMDPFAEERRRRAAWESNTELPPSPDVVLARKTALELGKARDIAALDHLITTRNLSGMRSFVEGWLTRIGRTSEDVHEMDKRIAANFEDVEMASLLIRATDRAVSLQVFELLLRDAEALAKWRADRRKRCKAQILGVTTVQGSVRTGGAGGGPAYVPGADPRSFWEPTSEGIRISWRTVCGPLEKDDPTFDPDGFRPGEMGPLRRAQRSIVLLPHAIAPGSEARVFPVLRDLSWYANADWSLVDKPAEEVFTSLDIPPGFLALFVERRTLVPMELLTEWLADYERRSPKLVNSDRHRTDTLNLLKLMRLHRTREAMAATARWTEPMVGIKDNTHREYVVRNLLESLAQAPPEAQVDLAALKTKILGGLPYEQVAAMSQVFQQVEVAARNPRAPEPLDDSLVTWMSPPGEEYLSRLDRGADVNKPDRKTGDTPLIKAVSMGVYWAAPLIDKGADVNAQGAGGRTALHAASFRIYALPEQPDVVALLLAKGAKVNVVTNDGVTPLHLAAASPKSLVLLLAAGATVDAVDNKGRSTLHNAAAAGNLEAVQVLLKAGANPNLESKAGTSPYSESLNSERSNVLAALEAGGGRLSMRQQSDRAYERAMRILVPLFW